MQVNKLPTHVPFTALPLPAGPLAPFFASVQAELAGQARARGVEFVIDFDMHALLRVNEEAVAAGTWEPMLPAANPRTRQLTRANAFWLRAVNPAGEWVTAQAAVSYDCTRQSIADHFNALTIFYDDPASAPAGEWCRCTSEAARATTGSVVWMVAGWTRPDYRGKGLFALAHRIGKVAAWLMWAPTSFMGVVDPEILPVWGERTMGPRLLDPVPTIHYNQVGLRELPMHFMHFPRAQFFGDLAEQLVVSDRQAA